MAGTVEVVIPPGNWRYHYYVVDPAARRIVREIPVPPRPKKCRIPENYGVVCEYQGSKGRLSYTVLYAPPGVDPRELVRIVREAWEREVEPAFSG
jgi:hypothetical protein